VTDSPQATDPSLPAPGPVGTHWDLVNKLKAEGAPREQVLERLKALGLDDESSKVLFNAVMGAMPSELPSAQLSGGTNVLSPSTFTLSDIGLTGHPTVVGLYWMGFGAAILLALGIGALMNVTDLVTVPEGVEFYALRLGGIASMAFIAWGVFRYMQGVTIRRR
jgi:hypothetical protein